MPPNDYGTFYWKPNSTSSDNEEDLEDYEIRRLRFIQAQQEVVQNLSSDDLQLNDNEGMNPSASTSSSPKDAAASTTKKSNTFGTSEVTHKKVSKAPKDDTVVDFESETDDSLEETYVEFAVRKSNDWADRCRDENRIRSPPQKLKNDTNPKDKTQRFREEEETNGEPLDMNEERDFHTDYESETSSEKWLREFRKKLAEKPKRKAKKIPTESHSKGEVSIPNLDSEDQRDEEWLKHAKEKWSWSEVQVVGQMRKAENRATEFDTAQDVSANQGPTQSDPGHGLVPVSDSEAEDFANSDDLDDTIALKRKPPTQPYTSHGLVPISDSEAEDFANSDDSNDAITLGRKVRTQSVTSRGLVPISDSEAEAETEVEDFAEPDSLDDDVALRKENHAQPVKCQGLVPISDSEAEDFAESDVSDEAVEDRKDETFVEKAGTLDSTNRLYFGSHDFGSSEFGLAYWEMNPSSDDEFLPELEVYEKNRKANHIDELKRELQRIFKSKEKVPVEKKQKSEVPVEDPDVKVEEDEVEPHHSRTHRQSENILTQSEAIQGLFPISQEDCEEDDEPGQMRNSNMRKGTVVIKLSDIMDGVKNLPLPPDTKTLHKRIVPFWRNEIGEMIDETAMIHAFKTAHRVQKQTDSDFEDENKVSDALDQSQTVCEGCGVVFNADNEDHEELQNLEAPMKKMDEKKGDVESGCSDEKSENQRTRQNDGWCVLGNDQDRNQQPETDGEGIKYDGWDNSSGNGQDWNQEPERIDDDEIEDAAHSVKLAEEDIQNKARADFEKREKEWDERRRKNAEFSRIKKPNDGWDNASGNGQDWNQEPERIDDDEIEDAAHSVKPTIEDIQNKARADFEQRAKEWDERRRKNAELSRNKKPVNFPQRYPGFSHYNRSWMNTVSSLNQIPRNEMRSSPAASATSSLDRWETRTPMRDDYGNPEAEDRNRQNSPPVCSPFDRQHQGTSKYSEPKPSSYDRRGSPPTRPYNSGQSLQPPDVASFRRNRDDDYGRPNRTQSPARQYQNDAPPPYYERRGYSPPQQYPSRRQGLQSSDVQPFTRNRDDDYGRPDRTQSPTPSYRNYAPTPYERCGNFPPQSNASNRHGLQSFDVQRFRVGTNNACMCNGSRSPMFASPDVELQDPSKDSEPKPSLYGRRGPPPTQPYNAERQAFQPSRRNQDNDYGRPDRTQSPTRSYRNDAPTPYYERRGPHPTQPYDSQSRHSFRSSDVFSFRGNREEGYGRPNETSTPRRQLDSSNIREFNRDTDPTGRRSQVEYPVFQATPTPISERSYGGPRDCEETRSSSPSRSIQLNSGRSDYRRDGRRDSHRSRSPNRTPSLVSRNERHDTQTPTPTLTENRYGRERERTSSRQSSSVNDRAPSRRTSPQSVRNERNRERRSPRPEAYNPRGFERKGCQERNPNRKVSSRKASSNERIESWIHGYRQTQKTDFFIVTLDKIREMCNCPNAIFPQPPLPMVTGKVASCLNLAMTMIRSPETGVCRTCGWGHGPDKECFDLSEEYKSYVIKLYNANLPPTEENRHRCLRCRRFLAMNERQYELCGYCRFKRN